MEKKQVDKTKVMWILKIVYLSITMIFLILGIVDQTLMGIGVGADSSMVKASFGPLSIFTFVSIILFLLIPLYFLVRLIRAKHGAQDEEPVAV